MKGTNLKSETVFQNPFHESQEKEDKLYRSKPHFSTDSDHKRSQVSQAVRKANGELTKHKIGILAES